MKSKHDKSNGSNSDRESNGKYDSKNAVSNDIDDSMSDGGDRSRSGSVNRNDRSSKGIYYFEDWINGKIIHNFTLHLR